MDGARDAEAIDAQLSALIDGELSAEEAARLRERLAAEPALAARHAELSLVTASLRELAAEPIADARLAGIRAGLESRLREAPTPAVARPSRPGAQVVPLRRRGLRWGAPLAAALAAGLALYLASGPRPNPLEEDAAPELATTSDPSPTAPLATAVPDQIAQDGSAGEDAFAVASEEDLAIGMDYDVLADFDVIAELDLLEALDAAELGKTEAM
jgi:anti-sigma factor RsiW